MKKLLPLLGLFALLNTSCTKDPTTEPVVKTFTGVLPIVSTNSPARSTAGQNIISNVRCELNSISGSIYFQGFEIKENPVRHYNIKANALYKNWNTQIEMPVMWALDTTVSIKTSTAGIYILNFYNSSILLKADTVQVN